MVRKYGRAGKIWTDDDLHQVASYQMLPKITFNSDDTAGDYLQYQVPFDCKVLGIQFYQAGDEGTDGEIAIQRFDDVAGTTQTELTAAYTMDAGAEGVADLTLTTTEDDLYIDAGDLINLLITTASGTSVACWVTIWVETLELVKY